MWTRLGRWVLKYRSGLLIALAIITVLMGWFASQVKLSYEFAKAIPSDNPKYKDYQQFRKVFGDDGNLMVIGFQSDHLFEFPAFQSYRTLAAELKNVEGVSGVLSIPGAVNLVRNDESERLQAVPIFENVQNQQSLDSAASVFFNLPFYQNRLYHPQNNAYLMVVSIQPQVLADKGRTQVISNIQQQIQQFEKQLGAEVHVSGLPLIRTVVADRIQGEMKVFLLASVLLSALILFWFFRSFSTMLLSMGVVAVGVIWTVALIHLFGYQITLLTALIPSLVVIIGIPNCIYFINKYHVAFLEKQNKTDAIVEMVSKMGIVTLFCNIVAGIGFAVFALTESAILKEFGAVAGLGILFIFVVSFIMLPAILSYLPAPRNRELKYLESKIITSLFQTIQGWVFNKQKWIIGITLGVLAFSVAGIFKLKTVGFIVDDLPKGDVIYRDLRFFEKHFKGVMPLEILVDAKKKNSYTGLRALPIFEKIDSLSAFIAQQENMSKPLSVAEGLKFAKQAFYEGDSLQYLMPNSFDGAFVGSYLRPPKKGSGKTNALETMLQSFIDSSRQITRISVNMADVGTAKLPGMIERIKTKTDALFDTAKYQVTFTGTSITFQEGSRFIINGLTESILWAFLLIALCMLYLFRSARILFCSLIPNVIPLLITAGVMGWVGLPLKPSTVLVFSVALGIAVDITIRFLVNYKQELPMHQFRVADTVKATIHHTGLSILYTTGVLIAGFIIFCLSNFGGTIALGWLTSLTLVTATCTNLILLPVLLLYLGGNKRG
ncbi:MAG: MMPL family transporter [Ferruginibacter sp.]|nr:MMPL family transporter [Ferruginibacter sp.]